MKREIRFRARTLEGEMVYFSLYEVGTVCAGDNVFYVSGVPCVMDTEEQYTGLKDSEGTEIYENDQVIQVLLGEHDANIPDDIFEGVVVWDTNGWAIKGHDGRIETNLMPCDKYTRVDIIGSSYEGIREEHDDTGS